MSAAIGLYGTRFNRQITQEEISSIASATSVDNVSSIWGRIADWFCGTKKEEAKKSLFKLLNDKVTTKDKFVAFGHLKELSSEHYKENFKNVDGELLITSYLGDTLFRLKKDFIEVDAKEISSRMMEFSKKSEEVNDIFKKDFVRGVSHGCYSINGESVTSEDDLRCFSNDVLSCYRAIANQATFGTVIDYAIQNHQAFLDCPTNEINLKYDITRQSDGRIEVTASCYKDAASGSNFEYIKDMIKTEDQFKRTVSIDAVFEIAPPDIIAKNIEYYSVN